MGMRNAAAWHQVAGGAAWPTTPAAATQQRLCFAPAKPSQSPCIESIALTPRPAPFCLPTGLVDLQQSLATPRAATPRSTPEEEALAAQIALHEGWARGAGTGARASQWTEPELESAYARCGDVTSEYAKTFFLGTQLMTPEQAKAIWAIYVWCRCVRAENGCC